MGRVRAKGDHRRCGEEEKYQSDKEKGKKRKKQGDQVDL